MTYLIPQHRIFLRLKPLIVILIFLLLLFFDAPEYIICLHPIPDEIQDLSLVLSYQKITSAQLHFEKVNRIDQGLHYSPIPIRERGNSYLLWRESNCLSTQNLMLSYHLGLKKSDEYLKRNTRLNREPIDQEESIKLIKPSLFEFMKSSNQSSSTILSPDSHLRI